METPILAFFSVSFLIGIHASGRIRGKVKNYFVAGQIIPFWVLALSLAGQAIELGGTQENARLALGVGFWAGAIYPVGIGISLLMIGLFYAEPLRRMQLLTLPDFYLLRFDWRSELLASLLCVISFIILLAGNLAGLGILLQYLIGVPPIFTLIGVGSLVMIYTMAGGLFAVTWNDVFHVGIAIVGFFSALIWMIVNHEPAQLASVVERHFSWDPFTQNAGALPMWATLLALGLGDIVALDFMERVFAAKNPRAARISCLLSGAVTISVGVALAALGVIATLKVNPESELTFLYFVRDSLPEGISMMFFMGLIAAAVSTIDGAAMACTTVVSKNIIQQHFSRLIPRHRLLNFSRLTAVPLMILAIALAIIRPVPGALLVLAFDVVFAGCLVPLTLGIYWKRSTANAAFWSMIIPSLLRVALYFVIPPELAGLDTLLPPLVSLILFVALTLWADAPPDESRGATAGSAETIDGPAR